DDTPTVRNRSKRRFPWPFAGLGAGALLAAGGALAWVLNPSPTVVTGRPPAPPSATAESTVTAGPLRAATLPGCLVPLPASGRCPETVECFGAVRVSDGLATAETVACGSRHTWEVYAVGDLPADSTPADLPRARADDMVRRVCNEGNFRAVSLRMDPGWRFEVLPPTAAALSSGDRTFRCLAGKGPDRLTGPTLAR
ncbi:MAG TPA: septum formation family protein, partial [Micromonosporaceae bacterium]|nr:septum formation family protein [Micromonosporaceae bacterium]